VLHIVLTTEEFKQTSVWVKNFGYQNASLAPSLLIVPEVWEDAGVGLSLLGTWLRHVMWENLRLQQILPKLGLPLGYPGFDVKQGVP
jgi:hypothetical protein